MTAQSGDQAAADDVETIESITALVSELEKKLAAARQALRDRGAPPAPAPAPFSVLSKTMVDAAFELSPDGVLVVDRRGERRFHNRRYRDMWGLTDEILEQEPQSAVSLRLMPMHDDPEAYRRRMDEIAEQMEVDSFDVLPLRDGRWIERHSAPLRLQGGEVRGRVWFFRDITERLKSAADQSLLAAIVRSSPDAIASVDLEGRVTTWNRGAERILGFTGEDMIGRARLLRRPDGRADHDFIDIMDRIRAGAEHGSLETVRLRKDGSPVFLSLSYSAVKTAAGETIGGVYIGRDDTEHKRAEAELIRLARFDDLTGVLNRATFVRVLRDAIARTRDSEGVMAVLALDFDHFKYINDTLGYPTGDRLLAILAGRLSDTVGDVGTVGRLGGNAFVVLIETSAERSEIERTGRSLLEAICQPVILDGSPLRVGASMGIAMAGPVAPDATTFMSQAEIAMHEAKRDNPGGVRLYTRAMDEAVHRVMRLGADLREAIEAGGFRLLYQPQADGESGAVTGAEALIRLTHPERGFVSPGEFIPIAERLGLAPAIGRWVIHEACRQIRVWLDAGLSPPKLAINLSATQFNTPGEIERDLEAALSSHRLTPDRLDLELTETVLMQTSVGQNDALMRLRARGFSLSIDDFGAGYSSLDYLRRFSVDRIKIDGSFVRDIGSTDGAEAIIKAIIALARQLGIGVVAEGVETRTQRDLLSQWNCRSQQGYHFSRPIDAETFAALVRSGRPLPTDSRS